MNGAPVSLFKFYGFSSLLLQTLVTLGDLENSFGRGGLPVFRHEAHMHLLPACRNLYPIVIFD